MEEIIGLLFLDRNLTHLEHLKTSSHAQHVALAGFYENIIDLADKLAEAYQGYEGVMQNIPLLNKKPEGAIVDILQDHMYEIESTRRNACKLSAIQNIIDEIVSLYLSTIYKLRELN